MDITPALNAARTTFDDKPSIAQGLVRKAAGRPMRTLVFWKWRIGESGSRKKWQKRFTVAAHPLPQCACEKGWGQVAVGRPHLENQLSAISYQLKGNWVPQVSSAVADETWDTTEAD